MSATNLPKLGPCQARYGPVGAETELGKTHGGVIFRCRDEVAPILYDQFGTGPYDEVIVGKPTEIECNFANLSYELLESLMPTQATVYESGGGTPTPAPGDDAIDVWLGLGTSCRDNAARLILVPYVNGLPSADIEDWIYVPLCYPKINMEWTFDAESQRVVNVTFTAYPVSQTAPRVWFMGNEALIPVA